MNFKKILLIGIDRNKLDLEYWSMIDELAEIKVQLPKDSEDIISELSDIDCLLVNFGVNVDKEMVDNAPGLKYIGVLATAYGKIDTDHAKSRGIVVCNLPGYSTESVAEFVFAVILEHIRGLEEGKQRGRTGNYSEAGISAREIKGSKFGILGLGRIGQRVADLALGFGANVRYWSRNQKDQIESKGIVKYEDLDKLLAEADFLSLHLAQTPETENFLNNERIQKIKKGAVIINTAPMELVSIDALEKRLAMGDITFILDHSDEMKEEDLQRLSKHINCIIYPPIAYITVEARIAKQKMFIENIRNFLKGSPINIV